MSDPTFIDWCAGIGGFRLGLERVGIFEPAEFRCVWAAEKEPVARTIYAQNFGHFPQAADILDVEPSIVPRADVWCAGFPCQDNSRFGRRKGLNGTRSQVIWKILDLAEVLRPRWLLMENVPNLLSVNGGRDFGELLARLEDIGYVGAWRCFDAQWFGTPQRRRRLFILAELGGRGGSPEEVLESEGDRRISATRRQGRRAPSHGLPGRSDESLSPFDGDLTFAFSVKNHGTDVGEIAPTLRSMNFDKSWKNGGGQLAFAYVHDDEWIIRQATPTECERLQGFPDNWTAGVADYHRYAVLGNAVPVPVVQWIGTRLMRAIRAARQPCMTTRDWKKELMRVS
jgi:DNA (cytosine-5)-methyltransferase 1